MSEELKAIAGDGFAVRVERCCECGVFVSDWVEADHRNGRICRPCESVLSLREQVRKLQAFKDWVHGYLDSKDVPHHPPGTHGAEGCRIGDRMDWLMANLTAAKQQIEELTAWKTSAIEHWPPVQEIGTVLRLPVGSDANKGILPAVEKLVDKHDALAARCAELEAEVADARTVQQQLASERATALEALAGERRRIELSKATASEVWATHEKQFADQQEKLDAVTARNAELEKERDELREELDGLATTSTGEMLAEAQSYALSGQEREVKHLARIAELEKELHEAKGQATTFCEKWVQLEAEAARLREDAASACEAKAEEIYRICKVEGTESERELHSLIDDREALRRSAKVLRAMSERDGK